MGKDIFEAVDAAFEGKSMEFIFPEGEPQVSIPEGTYGPRARLKPRTKEEEKALEEKVKAEKKRRNAARKAANEAEGEAEEEEDVI